MVETGGRIYRWHTARNLTKTLAPTQTCFEDTQRKSDYVWRAGQIEKRLAINGRSVEGIGCVGVIQPRCALHVRRQERCHAGLTTLEPAKADGAIMNPFASWQKSTTTTPASAKSFMSDLSSSPLLFLTLCLSLSLSLFGGRPRHYGAHGLQK